MQKMLNGLFEVAQKHLHMPWKGKKLRRYYSHCERTDRYTVAIYLRYWLETYCKQNLAANTLRGYQVNVENHIIPEIGGIWLNELTPQKIQLLYTALVEKGLSGTTIRYVHNNLHKALGQAVKWRLIQSNPSDFVEAPKVDHYEAHTLSSYQVIQLLKCSQGQDIYLPVLLGVTLGLRRGEILGLQWDDVDLGAKTITIRQTASFRASELYFSKTKTRNGRRTLLIPDTLCTILTQALEDQKEQAAQIGPSYNTYGLVCCRFDGGIMTAGAFNYQYKKTLKQCGLPPIRIHDLRHTNATLLLQGAVPAKIVSARLGHSSIGITMDIYSHVSVEMQKVAVDVLDYIFSKIA